MLKLLKYNFSQVIEDEVIPQLSYDDEEYIYTNILDRISSLLWIRVYEVIREQLENEMVIH